LVCKNVFADQTLVLDRPVPEAVELEFVPAPLTNGQLAELIQIQKPVTR